jgi:hypothetical protein
MTDEHQSKLEVNTKSEPSPSRQESVEESAGVSVRRSERSTAIKNRLEQLSTKTLELKHKLEYIRKQPQTERRLTINRNRKSRKRAH